MEGTVGHLVMPAGLGFAMVVSFASVYSGRRRAVLQLADVYFIPSRVLSCPSGLNRPRGSRRIPAVGRKLPGRLVGVVV